MIFIEKYPETGRICFPEELKKTQRLVFFDIETTGLSAYNSSLYLIGALVFENESWRLLQWFSPSLSAEIEILRAFFSFLKEDDLLVSFNGETFDINYLNACAAQYTIESPLSGMKHLDILKKVRKHRKLLGLNNLRQKTIEQFLGITREDRFSGGELISVYNTYSSKPDPRLLHLLLLHNEEDLLGMPALLPVLLYTEALENPGNPSEVFRNKSGSRLFICYRYNFEFPKDIVFDDISGIRCAFHSCQLSLEIPMIYDELKYFFPNYRDYYYLPVEDRAIHKKLGKFVDKAFRTPASPENCYTKQSGFFVPALKSSGLPIFKKNYDADMSYHALEERDRFITTYADLFFSAL